jgi:uncharacterized protein
VEKETDPLPDYRINTYFRDSQGMWVNLYIPSTLRWTQDGAQVVLTQRSTYPFDRVVEFDVKTSQVKEFAMSFRIPGWAEGASISLNGRRVQTPTTLEVLHRFIANGILATASKWICQ